MLEINIDNLVILIVTMVKFIMAKTNNGTTNNG
jgi:hypothetical protein